ncbi:anaerobic ribonucleoside-triphosphate reductase [Acutalibacter caecimuris]|uniref:anaerobic ribonucleoside-triphosphate reductase n=1 Tax=Acutalibacter caecimuris TaxID=3093657 RepID=UPI002AC92763|nr:anaerobic ribonucleoside-triphosphate reductase [Acutalibacter sp. M00118]
MSNTSKKNANITGTDQIMVGEGRDFERIRRITGYLVGTIDRWNNAKRAEERDRVKHSMRQEPRV